MILFVMLLARICNKLQHKVAALDVGEYKLLFKSTQKLCVKEKYYTKISGPFLCFPTVRERRKIMHVLSK